LLKNALEDDPSINYLIPKLQQIIATRHRIIHVHDAVGPFTFRHFIRPDLAKLAITLRQALIDGEADSS